MIESSFSDPILFTTPQRHPQAILASSSFKQERDDNESNQARNEMILSIIRLAMQWV
jgi:hypothetical protein